MGANRGRYGFGGATGRGDSMLNRGRGSNPSYTRGRGFQPASSRGGKSYSDQKCYTCGRSGHYSPECTAKSSSKNTVICQLCKKNLDIKLRDVVCSKKFLQCQVKLLL